MRRITLVEKNNLKSKITKTHTHTHTHIYGKKICLCIISISVYISFLYTCTSEEQPFILAASDGAKVK